MIAHLSGIVLATKNNLLVLDVHGVGYRVYCTKRTLESMSSGDEVSVFTHLAVREDAMDLFGFQTSEELELFTMLISISGIGPRSALGIIGLETTEKLVSAIANGDVNYLTKVSGVGRKSAEKIVLELREKMEGFDISNLHSTRRDEEDVLEALKTLGYRADEARDALRQIPAEIEEQGALIKEALKLLSRG
jgi:holliday junction DNA helicase RuvA